jgi:hypothetical protein
MDEELTGVLLEELVGAGVEIEELLVKGTSVSLETGGGGAMLELLCGV